LLCFAKLEFTADYKIRPTEPRAADVQIAVGNTATEALSALLASLDGENNAESLRVLEEQLEALHLLPDLVHRQLDIGPKFKEARHSKGFQAVSGGTIWSVRPVPESQKDHSAEAKQPTLSPAMGHALNQLNIAQQAYDQACFQIESLRERVFADWYKYMLSAYPPDDQRGDYPDVDEVMSFIEQQDLAPLDKLVEETGFIFFKEGSEEPILQEGAAPESKARKVEHWWNEVHNLLDEKANESFQVQKIAGPRFWQPNEPVILLHGADVEPTNRHRHQKPLQCQIEDIEEARFIDWIKAGGLQTSIDAIFDAQKETPETEVFGCRTVSSEPWHPFLLEWEVAVHPSGGEKGNLHATRRAYSPDFITSNYRLAEHANELTPQEEIDYTVSAASYQGRSLLTPHAKMALHEQIDHYLEQFILPSYYQANDNVMSEPGYFQDHRQEVLDWLKADDAPNFSTFVGSIERTHNTDFHILAQSLSGFNAAMLGHEQTMQLGISDPLGFSDYQEFAADVREAVGKFNRVAPQPQNDFNPIRTGVMNITNLRLIDTFGQFRDVKISEYSGVVAADALQNDRSKPGHITLPPRLMQPARLNLRWKSSGHGPGYEKELDWDDIEMNAHPATSPICGWLLPNNLDGSLMVYSQQGQAIGYLDKNNRWRSSPGSKAPLRSPADIVNPHLRRVVQWINGKKAESSDFLYSFISTLDSALENIDPENWAHHQDLALLMGRPLAVVRASLNLEIKGLPAINHSWDVFWQDLKNGRSADADTDGVREVQFPVRLGEHRQLNDGLAGYWLEGDHEELGSDFYSPQSGIDDSASTPLIHTYLEDSGSAEQVLAHERKLQHKLHLNQSPKSLTMLVDPRGKVHATSGILPTKSIDIPPDQYAAALQAIEITFLSAPILALRRQGEQTGEIDLPLPEEPGYAWAWVEQNSNGQWQEASKIGLVNRQAQFVGPSTIREGWLALRKVPKKPGE
jgi:hypothetical protein